MAEFLLLRLEAPMMSFGGTLVDQHGPTERFPAISMVTGLLANALGWDHADTDRLNSLQARLRFAARCDRVGEHMIDYQTVDLGQPHLRAVSDSDTVGWTSWHRPEARGGGKSVRTGTHQRYRHYLVDTVYTVAVGLDGDGSPVLDEVQAALVRPARPLFLGRKCCLPSVPLLLGAVEADSVVEAVRRAPKARRGEYPGGGCDGWWPGDESHPDGGHFEERSVTDERRWRVQLHGGERVVRHGFLLLHPEVDNG